MDLTIINIIMLLMLLIIISIYSIIVYNTIRSLQNRINNIEANMNEPVKKLNLSIDEINKHVDTVFEEIKQNKYHLYFKLKELTIIPNMDKEIESMSKDVLHAFSPEFLNTLFSIYSEEYVVQMITRRTQQFMVDYLAANKPKSK